MNVVTKSEAVAAERAGLVELVGRSLAAQAQGGHNQLGRSLDLADVAVRDAARGIARVVTGEGLPHGRLRVLTECGRGVAIHEHAVGRRQVAAGIEGVREGQTQPRQIGAVDLHEAEIDGVMADRGQLDARGNGVLAGRGVVGAARGVVVQRQNIEAAFGAGDRGQGLNGDVRRAARGKLREGGKGKGSGVSSSRQKTEDQT